MMQVTIDRDMLLRRLFLWRQSANQHRQAMAELDAEDTKESYERQMHQIEADTFERCAAELSSDLAGTYLSKA